MRIKLTHVAFMRTARFLLWAHLTLAYSASYG
jgi:hypothetical protein